MSVYSKRLAGPQLVTALVTSSLGVVPAGKVWVVKQVVVMSNNIACRCLFTLGAPGSVVRLFDYPATLTANIETRLILTAGEQISALIGTATATAYVALYGYELDP